MNTTDTAVAAMAERFQRDTAGHEMTVLHDDGLYRHLRFAQPEPSWLYWFEIVTWPGSLAIKGDCGTYLFSRTPDMFSFFRDGSHHSINPGYWGEKTPDGPRSVREYSEDLTKTLIRQAISDYETDVYPDRLAAQKDRKAKYDAALTAAERTRIGWPDAPMTPAEARERLADFDADGLLSGRSGADELIRALNENGVVPDSAWEWDLTDWQWHFLWCCHAIVLGITKYDAQRAARTPAHQ